jgi:hypothetical protein
VNGRASSRRDALDLHRLRERHAAVPLLSICRAPICAPAAVERRKSFFDGANVPKRKAEKRAHAEGRRWTAEETRKYTKRPGYEVVLETIRRRCHVTANTTRIEQYNQLSETQLAHLDIRVPGQHRAIITPTLAKRWLDEHNTRNRSITATQAAALVDALACGLWQFNGDAIRFATTGTLLDGQKRLLACYITGIPIDTIIITGLSETTMSTIDIGEGRKVAHLIGFQQGRDPMGMDRHRQSVAGGLLVWDSNPPCDFHYMGGNSLLRVPGCVAEVYFLLKESIDGAMPAIRQMQDGGAGILSPKSTGVLRVLFGRVDQEKAKEFFDHLCSGANLGEGHPILVLSKMLVKNKAKVAKRITESDKVYMTIKAWNLWVKGKTCASNGASIYRAPSSDAWPEIEGLVAMRPKRVVTSSSERTRLRKYLSCIQSGTPFN